MASLPIRKLDDTVKAYLRLRSAKSGRSVEEEVRVILRETLEGRAEFAAAPSHPVPPLEDAHARPIRRTGAMDQPPVTLIIGGGIPAYPALDLLPPLPDPPLHPRCLLA